MKCQVCDTNESVGVASSSLGAMSLAFCSQCLQKNAEPKEMILQLINDCGGIDEVSPAYLNTLTYYEDGKYLPIKGIQIPKEGIDE